MKQRNIEARCQQLPFAGEAGLYHPLEAQLAAYLQMMSDPHAEVTQIMAAVNKQPSRCMRTPACTSLRDCMCPGGRAVISACYKAHPCRPWRTCSPHTAALPWSKTSEGTGVLVLD